MIRSNLSYRRAFQGLGLLVVACGLAYAFHAIGGQFFGDWALDVGRITLPAPRVMYFSGFWMVIGGLACWALATGMAMLFDFGENDDPPWYRRDGVWIAACALTAFIVPAFIRAFVLEGAPLTDDEYSYLFMARVLADGQLYAQSLPEPISLFFDRGHMINGGRWYAQYFVGWPALMAPGVWLGIPGWMNPLYASLTVVPLFLVLRRLGGSRTARYGTLLFVVAPFSFIAAATLSSHVTTLLFIIATWWALIETRHTPDRGRWHLLTAVFFSIAFFIRPLAALGAAGPAVGIWVYDRIVADSTWTETFSRGWIFVLPAVVFAALFLGVNAAQTGDPLQPAYQAFHDYASENGYRFSGTSPNPEREVANLRFDDLERQAATLGLGLFRFNIAAFGWPLSLAFVLVAAGRRDWTLWLSAGGYLLTRAFLHDPGVDTYGPVHFYELLWPLIGLSAIGLTQLRKWCSGLDDGARPWLRQWPKAAVISCTFLAATCYLPYRLATVGELATAANLPMRAATQQTDTSSVVFASRPFANPCATKPARSFALWRPTNPPDLKSQLLWVNHISVKDDRRLMKYFPDREGWILLWTDDCKLNMVPLDEANPVRVPDGSIGGDGTPPDWSTAPDPFNIDDRRGLQAR